jgi:hypothetical protein
MIKKIRVYKRDDKGPTSNLGPEIEAVFYKGHYFPVERLVMGLREDQVVVVSEEIEKHHQKP